MNEYAQRLQDLRNEMREENIDIYLILTSDPHLSEYIPDFWKVRNFLVPFNGSSASILITQERADLWTDGRYFLEAKHALEKSEFTLQKIAPGQGLVEWIIQNVDKNLIIGIDYKTISISLFNQIKKFNVKDIDLISRIWTNRPPLPKTRIYPHKIEFTHLTRKEKISTVRVKIKELGATCHIISSLDDICYLTNLRGSDVEYNPVFLSFMIISQEYTLLFVDSERLDDEIKKELEDDGIGIKRYDEFELFLESMQGNILLDPLRSTVFMLEKLSTDVVYAQNPSTLMKSIKSDFEISHIRDAMEADGVALVKFLIWIGSMDKQNKREDLSEIDIVNELQKFRMDNPLYISDSFSTISGFKGNGAIVHYCPGKNCSKLEGSGLLLLDSGAQYQNGTTDITRVLAFGDISKEQKRDYTLVLKSHIAIASARFPSIPLPYLDSVGRVILWNEGLDYMHGTGHGIGYFLNVHEGPQVLSYFSNSTQKIIPGMMISVEPGLYIENKWGIRLENLVVAVEVSSSDGRKDLANLESKSTYNADFLEFETLTLCPFEIRCIEKDMLNTKEIRWINVYHKMVFDRLKDKLNKYERDWLREHTKEI